MKRILCTLIYLIAIVSVITAQRKGYIDTALQAKKAAKQWLYGWDKGEINIMKKFSADSTDESDLKKLITIHQAETDMINWHTAKWWKVRRDTAFEYELDSTGYNHKIIRKVPGYLVIASPDRSSAELPLFLILNSKGKWVVHIEYSQLCLCGEEDDDKRDENCKDKQVIYQPCSGRG